MSLLQWDKNKSRFKKLTCYMLYFTCQFSSHQVSSCCHINYNVVISKYKRARCPVLSLYSLFVTHTHTHTRCCPYEPMQISLLLFVNACKLWVYGCISADGASGSELLQVRLFWLSILQRERCSECAVLCYYRETMKLYWLPPSFHSLLFFLP